MSVVGADVRMTDCMDREHRRRKGLIFTSHGSAIRTSRRFAMKGIFHRTTRQHVRALAMSLLLSATTFGTARLNAQSCAVPFQWQPDVTLPGFSNTTCGGPHVADSFCDNQFDNVHRARSMVLVAKSYLRCARSGATIVRRAHAERR